MTISAVEHGDNVMFQAPSAKTRNTKSKESPFIFKKGEIALELITKDSAFMQCIGNKVIQNLVKKKLNMDVGIDISELSITDNGDTVTFQVSADVDISKTDILKLVMKSKGE